MRMQTPIINMPEKKRNERRQSLEAYAQDRMDHAWRMCNRVSLLCSQRRVCPLSSTNSSCARRLRGRPRRARRVTEGHRRTTATERTRICTQRKGL